MAVKKTTSTSRAAAKIANAIKAEPAKAAKTAAKAIETKKDTTKKLETKAAVLVDTPETEEKAAVKNQ